MGSTVRAVRRQRLPCASLASKHRCRQHTTSQIHCGLASDVCHVCQLKRRGIPCGLRATKRANFHISRGVVHLASSSTVHIQQCCDRCKLIGERCSRLSQHARSLQLSLRHGAKQTRRAAGTVAPFVLRSTSCTRRPAPASGLNDVAARCVSTTTSRAAASRSNYPAKQPRVPGQQPDDGGGGDAPTHRTEAQMRADAAQTAAGADADGARRRRASC